MLLSLAAAAAAAPAPKRVAALGHWVAIDRGATCEAGARPEVPAATREPEARAGVSFSADGRRNGGFHVRLSRTPRPGASVMLTVGARQFLLVGRGPWAFAANPQADMAILDAIRAATSMRVAARAASGRRFVDRYLLDGAPTAIDAAAAACSRKRQEGSRP